MGVVSYKFHSAFILTLFLSLTHLAALAAVKSRTIFSVKYIDPQKEAVTIEAEVNFKTPGETVLYFKAPGLSTDFNNLELRDSQGKALDYKQTEGGKIFLSSPSSHDVFVTYEVRLPYLDEKKCLFQCGHALFLCDLEESPADITFVLPESWRIMTVAPKNPNGSYFLDDVRGSGSEFLLGKFDYYEKKLSAVKILIGVEKGSPYKDEELVGFISDVVQTICGIIGGFPKKQVAIYFLQFPKTFPKIGYRGGGTADTRHFFSAGLENETDDFKKQVLWKFAHEIFHLFNPHAITPRDYREMVWFGEGFTDYMALKIMLYNHIYGQEEFSRACSAVYESMLRNPRRENTSLVKASQEFFVDSNSEKLVYEKGFLVAFLMDLELFFKGSEIKSLDDVLRMIYKKYGVGEKRLDSKGLINDLNSIRILNETVNKYIVKPESESGRISYSKFGLREVEEWRGEEKTIRLVFDELAPASVKKKLAYFFAVKNESSPYAGAVPGTPATIRARFLFKILPDRTLAGGLNRMTSLDVIKIAESE